MACSKKCGVCTLLSLGGVFVTIGVVLALFWTTLYNGILTTELVLTNSSKSYQLWKDTPIPIYMKMYMFNWTNAEEVVRSKWTVKPQMHECGPYVFSEHHVRVNVTWNENSTVTFRQVKTWQFVQSMSNGSLNDSITNINPITIVIGEKVKNLPTLVKEAINFLLVDMHENLYFTRTVDDLIFKGVEDPILDKLDKFHVKIPFKKFGWFYARNNSASYDGTFTMYTGKSDMDSLGELSLWNGMPNTTAYKGKCGDVNGTTGELWPPVSNREHVEIFASDICGQLSFEHNGTESVLNVEGKKFIGTDFTFDNGTKYPAQSCYRGDEVIASGARSISVCRFGSPAYMSYPHFYLADPSYLQKVTGLKPNKTEHESHLTIEPVTGITLAAKVQLQLNLRIESIKGMSIFDNVPPMYMPMIWFSQVAELPQKYCSMTTLLVGLGSVGHYVGWTVFAFGLLMSIVGFILIYRNRTEDEEEDHLIENES
ncbi:hypothetical protein PPYR_07771 [Photinus pyralis]|uniref:Scavenger receptor class B member 1 n=1 Tax=Photinus pyralis TaxID=7054 RepID=A0A1Y1ME42_PHOPY|nr:protein croquemort-like [Photinus pyralis]KAB0799891.1 hypothetical protein PPYR_07771 [Photinus pyralis]